MPKKITITYWTPNGYSIYSMNDVNALVAIANFATDHPQSLDDITQIQVEK